MIAEESRQEKENFFLYCPKYENENRSRRGNERKEIIVMFLKIGS